MSFASLAMPLASLAVATAALAACGTDSKSGPAQTATTGKRLSVVAAFYPLADAATAIGGADVDVQTLVGPGAEPHDFEPTPAQAEELANADLVLFLGGDFQPSVNKLVAETAPAGAAVDVLAAVGSPADPHVWLNPASMRAVAGVVADAIRQRDAASADRIDARAAAYDAKLAGLDSDYRSGLATCASRVVVSTHNAFGGLTAYGLTMDPIAGLSPSDEPSAKDLEAVVAAAKAAHVTTVFFEHALPKDLAETVAGEIGGTTAVLDPIETLTADQVSAGADYFSVMSDNLRALRTGLGCN